MLAGEQSVRISVPAVVVASAVVVVVIAAVVVVSGVSENATANKKMAVDENVSKGNDGVNCRAVCKT